MDPGIAAKLDRTVIHCRHGRGKPQLVVTLLPGAGRREAEMRPRLPRADPRAALGLGER